MRNTVLSLTCLGFLVIGAGHATASRPPERREKANYIVAGTVTAVYTRNPKGPGYRSYIVEMTIDEVEKGAGLRKGATFRAYCYQRTEGAGGLEFDSAGHTAVPQEGQRIKAFVNANNGRNEGVYQNWFDVIPALNKQDK